MLRVVNVSHAYGGIVSLQDLSFEVEPGEIVCLLGPSGCGKTTLLRIIAGLETEYDGVVCFNGGDIRATPAHKRGFGLMFQDFALFPHLSVAGNIAYGLKRRGLRREEIRESVRSLLRRVGLKDLGERDVAALSGGQKQRVALARSLAPNPRLLMLDEPLGSLDAQLRDQLALELRRIIKDAGLSAIYVTHDHREAYAVADRIAVMNIGSVRQLDKPFELYRQPASAYVARFLGLTNVYSAGDSRLAGLLNQTNIRSLRDAAWILIHPRGIGIGAHATNDALELTATLEDAVFRGEHYQLTAVTGSELRLSFTVRDLPVKIGDAIRVSVSPGAILPLPD